MRKGYPLSPLLLSPSQYNKVRKRNTLGRYWEGENKTVFGDVSMGRIKKTL